MQQFSGHLNMAGVGSLQWHLTTVKHVSPIDVNCHLL